MVSIYDALKGIACVKAYPVCMVLDHVCIYQFSYVNLGSNFCTVHVYCYPKEWY